MRKCLTKFRRIFECGAGPDGFVSGAVCFIRRTLARSVLLGFQIGVPRRKSVYVIDFPSFYSAFSVLDIFITSFLISVLFSKRRISVNLVDLVKSFQTSTSI